MTIKKETIESIAESAAQRIRGLVISNLAKIAEGESENKVKLGLTIELDLSDHAQPYIKATLGWSHRLTDSSEGIVETGEQKKLGL